MWQMVSMGFFLNLNLKSGFEINWMKFEKAVTVDYWSHGTISTINTTSGYQEKAEKKREKNTTNKSSYWWQKKADVSMIIIENFGYNCVRDTIWFV